MNITRLGIVGCGVIGQKLMLGASQDPTVEIAAVADLRESAARQAAETYKVPRVYTDPDALLNDTEVEGVVLALPAAGRAAIALRALAKHKHVLIEKPVAMNAAEVRQIIAARGDRLVGCCSPRFRVIDHARITTDLIATGALGDLRVLQARSLFNAEEPPASPPPPWRLNKSANGGGTLMNLGCYDLDYLLGLTGWKLKPRQVLAQAWPVPPLFESYVAPGSDAETHYVALIRCAGGEMIYVERAEYTTLRGEEAWRIIGTKGSLRLQMTPAEKHQIIFDEGVAGKGVVSHVLWEGEETHARGHAGVIHDFAEAIRDGRPPLTSIEQALVIQQICDAIYASAEQGQAVQIS